MNTEGATDQNSTITESLSYWEKEKLKALQRGEAKFRRINVSPSKHLSELLPGWERKKRKRLGKVQIVIEELY